MASEEQSIDAGVSESPEPKLALKTETITIEVPDVLGLVERYSFVNHMRVGSTGNDLRIAVADLNPVSKKPTAVVGFVMTHKYAREFVKALNRVIDSLDKLEESSDEAPEDK